MAENKNTYMTLEGQHEGGRLLYKPGHRRKDNIKLDLKAIRCDGLDRINLAPDTGQW
jgi:hypothetical protein